MATDLIEGSAIPVRRIYLRRLQPDAEPTLKLTITREGADFLIRVPFTTNPPQRYRSADLTHWEPVAEQQISITNNVLDHVVTIETNQKFYRAQQTIGQ